MNTALRLKIEMVVRVREFLRAHSFGVAESDALTEQFGKRVDRLLALRDQQLNGVQSMSATVTRRSEMRRRIRRIYLRQVADAARNAAAIDAQLAEHCALPRANCSEQVFLAVLRNTLASAIAGREILIAHGLIPSILEELPKVVADYEEQLRQGMAGRRASTGATMELAALSSELVRTVKQLDGMVRYAFSDRPELVGSWESVRNVAWPASAPATENEGRVDAA